MHARNWHSVIGQLYFNNKDAGKLMEKEVRFAVIIKWGVGEEELGDSSQKV